MQQFLHSHLFLQKFFHNDFSPAASKQKHATRMRKINISDPPTCSTTHFGVKRWVSCSSPDWKRRRSSPVSFSQLLFHNVFCASCFHPALLPCFLSLFSGLCQWTVMRARLNYPLDFHFHLERLRSTSSLVWCQSLPMDSYASWSHTMAHYLHVVVMDAVTTSPLLGRKSIISLLDTWSTLTPNPRGLGRTMTTDGRSPLSFWLRGEDISL